MPWEDFMSGYNKLPESEPQARLGTSGMLRLNGPAYTLLGSPDRVIFKTDKTRRAIAITPADRVNKDARQYSVNRMGDDGDKGATVNIRRVMEYMGIKSPEYVTAYPCHLENGMLVVEFTAKQTAKDGTE